MHKAKTKQKRDKTLNFFLFYLSLSVICHGYMIINIQGSFWNALKVLDINMVHQLLKIMLNIMTCYFVASLRIAKALRRMSLLNQLIWITTTTVKINMLCLEDTWGYRDRTNFLHRRQLKYIWYGHPLVVLVQGIAKSVSDTLG
jgi:hypothetical protein